MTTTTLRFTTGDRMRKAREHRGVSVNDMAVKLRVHRNTINNYEAEKGARPIPHSVVVAYATFLDIDIDWLLESEPPAPKQPDSQPVKTRRRRAVDQPTRHSPCNLELAA